MTRSLLIQREKQMLPASSSHLEQAGNAAENLVTGISAGGVQPVPVLAIFMFIAVP